MKIGFISTYSNSLPCLAYGGEMYYYGIVKTLSEMGHEVHLFATGGSECPKNGYLHYILGSKQGQIDYNLEVWIEKEYHNILMEMEIIHDCSLDHIVAERLKNLYGKTNIVNTINGSTYYMPRPPFNVVTGSKFWQEDAKKYGLNTEMIYWGVDMDFYTPEGKREDYFLWIARFHPSKGLDIVLDLAEVMGFPLKIAGSLSFKDHALYGKQYLDRIKNISNVEYVQLPMDSTHHHTKRDLYRRAKAFLYPVQYDECFGLVVAEAMSCGCPVITTPRGAMPELVIHKKTGFLCTTKNEFCNAILSLDEYEKNKWHHKGFDLNRSSKEHIMQFSWKNATESYVKLYGEVLNGKTW